MAAELLLLLLGLSAGPGLSSGSGPDSERGRMELRRVRSLAAQPRYGGCWARALENLDMRCRDLTSESQSRIALRFTLCHLSSSGRDFPSCSEGSEVSRCTGAMDAVAFNTYTEFFTHTHSICHFLQSEAWQSRAENTMYRLTESSAGVAEQLQSTRQMAEDLIDAQSAALQAQQEILNNGEELRVTLRDSTQGLRSVFSELSSVSREQQVALSELFNRVSFLQSFLLMEAHSLSSCCYNAAALCTSFLLTSTQRSSRARYLLRLEVTGAEVSVFESLNYSGAAQCVCECVAAGHGVCRSVCPAVCVCSVQRPGAAESAGAAAAQRDAERPAGGAAARRVFEGATEERESAGCEEEIREQKKRGDADKEKGDKKRGGGGGGRMQHAGVSDRRRLRPVSPLTHRLEY
ncbi:uncharacterized protein LOC122882959 isoform X5 [Siniperca chuatsi]|uniref:uncharacterized protein LOC122882959 isoform X5 n=1 Tax=Siniperca chuatsi TaxID=119488 RepID=UPI001CE0FC14|nr:uncharacterized protein LOC122882959 isoform X5 [Siniperca chuatsi]